MDLWLRIYNQINDLGRRYKDSCFDIDGQRKLNLTEEEQKDLLSRISMLMLQSDMYLDKLKIIPSQPKWNYMHDDAESHASSKQFKYHHLVPTNVIKKYGEHYMSKI